MSDWQKVKIGEFLEESRVESITPNPRSRIKVRLNVKGVEKRPIKNSVKGATKYYIRRSGQFIYGKQNLFKGAFGVVPVSLNGFETSADLPCFDVDETICLPEWLVYFLKQGEYYKELEKIARGAGSRRISPKDFYKIEIPLPLIQDQKDILTKIKSNETIGESLSTEITLKQSLLKKLRQAILQEAIEGKLTKRWREDNTNVEPASILLEKIKTEKEQLIKNKKNKKQKALPPITDEEKPFELPNGWAWCHTNDACTYIIDCPHSTPRFVNDGSRCIDTTCINMAGDIIEPKVRRVDVETFNERNARLVPVAGDIVYSREGVVGQAVIVPLDYPICLGQRVMLFRPQSEISSMFFRYMVTSKFFLDEMFERHRGIGAKHVNMKDLRESFIPLPPVEEQNAIVAKVEKLFTICDELEGQINDSKANADILMQAVLKEAFEQ